MDPEIVEMVRFMDPEIVEKVDKSYIMIATTTTIPSVTGTTTTTKETTRLGLQCQTPLIPYS